MVKEILTQTWITWIQVIFVNTLLYPFSVRNCPGPERGVFCMFIVDLISRSTLVVFSLLCARIYHYNKGPVIVDKLTITTIHAGLFCMIFQHSISLRWEINIVFISIYNFFLMDKMYHCLLNSNDILIFVIFQIEISSINFSCKFRICAFFVFNATIFWGSQKKL